MPNKLGDRARLQHILDAIIEIENYIMDAEFSEFMNNSMMRFACIKQMEIIGEAGNQITGETKGKFSEIEWKQIVGMRNVLVHEYFGVDTHLVWEVIKEDMPGLKTSVAKILDQMK